MMSVMFHVGDVKKHSRDNVTGFGNFDRQTDKMTPFFVGLLLNAPPRKATANGKGFSHTSIV